MTELQKAKQIIGNEWEPLSKLERVLNVIKKLSKDDGVKGWQWWKNPNCKYINIKVDMRDGAFVLTNRKGERISVEVLEKQ